MQDISTPAGLLRAARDLMNHGGRHWYKGGFSGHNEDGETAYCSAGAINQLASGDAAEHSMTEEKKIAVLALAQAIRPTKQERDYFDALSVIYRFNDAKKRMWPEVKAKFTEAAKLAAKKTVSA